MITNSHIGKRVLLKMGTSIFETVIQEISPSGQNVKFGGVWHEIKDYSVVEVLKESPDGKQLLCD